MLEQAWQKKAIAVRRDIRDHERGGWEYVGEGGGKLWELERGGRWDHVITDVHIAKSGKGVWIKASRPTPEHKEE